MTTSGDVIRVAADENAELFAALPASSGSLALLLTATLRIQRSQPYVAVQYKPTSNYEDAVNQLSHQCAYHSSDSSPLHHPVPQFVEAVLYSPNSGLIITANMVSADSVDFNNLMQFHWFSPFFFDYSQQRFLQQQQGGREFQLLHQYLFRHDRGIFWTIVGWLPFTRYFLIRLLIGWLLDSRLRRLFPYIESMRDEGEREKMRVIQDAIVPIQETTAILKLTEEVFGIFPIWLCPLKTVETPQPQLLSQPSISVSKLYVDVGIYGSPSVSTYDPIPSHRLLESYLRNHSGCLAPYAVCYSTEAEFWEFYNKQVYKRLRKRFAAEGVLIGLYERIGGGSKVAHFQRKLKSSLAENR